MTTVSHDQSLRTLADKPNVTLGTLRAPVTTKTQGRRSLFLVQSLVHTHSFSGTSDISVNTSLLLSATLIKF